MTQVKVLAAMLAALCLPPILARAQSQPAGTQDNTPRGTVVLQIDDADDTEAEEADGEENGSVDTAPSRHPSASRNSATAKISDDDDLDGQATSGSEEPSPEAATQSQALAEQVRFSAAKSTASGAATFKKLVPGTIARRLQPAVPSPQTPVPPAPPLPPGEEPKAEEVATGFKTIDTLTARIAAEGDKFPSDAAGEVFAQGGDILHTFGTRREWAASNYFWVAPGLCHNPLYFEDINLERHGHSFGLLQPAVSVGHFFVRIPFWPYMMAINPPRECVYTLGYYRPGSYAPFCLHHPPIRARGILAEGAAVTAVFLIFP
jgi:hypothetical protein